MNRNPASIALGAACAASLILGAILWIVGVNQLGHDQTVADYANAFSLDSGTGPLDSGGGAIAADNALIWWGIGLVIFGALLFIATLVTWAITRQMRVQAEPAPKSYNEYLSEK